jgi:peroxiredoxin
MSNHCPFVQHVIDKVVELHEDYQAEGIQVIGINANDLEQSPEDSPEKMLDFIKERNITFPYLYDESQAIAKGLSSSLYSGFLFVR